jgi:hypothetical protein
MFMVVVVVVAVIVLTTHRLAQLLHPNFRVVVGLLNLL